MQAAEVNLLPSKNGMEIYLRGATKITISAIIIAASIRGCISVLVAPPPKLKLTGASGPNVNPLNQSLIWSTPIY